MILIVDSPPLLASPKPPCSAAERYRRAAGEAGGALGPRWVRAMTVAHGHQRSPAVTDGSEEPQVAGPFGLTQLG